MGRNDTLGYCKAYASAVLLMGYEWLEYCGQVFWRAATASVGYSNNDLLVLEGSGQRDGRMILIRA